MMKPIIEMIQADMRTEQEVELLRLVQSYGFNVDRTRLMAALTDARRFYDEGYRDGLHESRWISVEDRLPEPYELVAVYIKIADGGWPEISRIDEGGCWSATCVTHWMPLPEPPEGGASDG